jgi:hypothetical protein
MKTTTKNRKMTRMRRKKKKVRMKAPYCVLTETGTPKGMVRPKQESAVELQEQR